MTRAEIFALALLTLFSLADLRYRLVPGIELFLFGAIFLALPDNLVQTGLVLCACAWGVFRNSSVHFVLPLLFYPPAWPILLTAYAYRRGVIGRADLIAISSLACLFPFYVVLLSLFGLEAWRRIWLRRQTSPIPALPGMLLGLIAFLLVRLLFQIT